jgi:DNA polymerase (family 10)
MNNGEISGILREIGEYLQMREESIFKVKAYEKAAESIASLLEEVADIYKKGGVYALKEISGVGQTIAEKIAELLETGHLRYYAKLKKETPVRLSELTRVEGLGPKSILRLYKELGVRNLKQLEEAAKKGKIKGLKGFGEKSEENILRGVAFIKKSGGRFILGAMMPMIEEIKERLQKIKGVKKIVVAGSVRRGKETIGDVDMLVVSENSRPIMDYFVAMPEVIRIYAHGGTKSSIRIGAGIDVDLRVVPEKSYGAALNYFTGSKEHNIALRQIAIDKGYKLSEYGLFKGKKPIAGKNEEEIYRALGLDYIEPELREMTGEIAAANNHQLPKLIGRNDLRGDLQVQTNWSDGAHSIAEMAQAAVVAGLEYMVVTDHSKRLAMANGLDAKRVLQQIKEIEEINENLKLRGSNFRILKGSECDILKNGDLDLADEILEKLDVVGASIHSYFNLSRPEQTERLKKAMANPHVDIIFHPTGRIINKRPPCDLDIEEIIKMAGETGTILEINAFPDRSDLKDDYIKKCVQSGVKMAVNSDSHSVNHFSMLKYGIVQARRGWAKKSDIINAWPLEKMLSMLKHGK